jgi:cyclic dehypoxanthinyl futalosine synthase
MSLVQPERHTGSPVRPSRRYKEAGFKPQLRNQQYEFRELPAVMEEQVIDY